MRRTLLAFALTLMAAPVLAEPKALIFTDYGLTPKLLRPAADGLVEVGAPAGSQASDLRATAKGGLIYTIYRDDGGWDWFELDLVSLASRPIAKSAWIKGGFMDVLPYARSDGSWYADVHFPYASPVYTVHPSRGARAFLAKPGLYGFAPLADGSYVYATWAGAGAESPDFVDMHPGTPMSLWHQPLKGGPKLLGRYGSIQQLQPVMQGKAFVFAVPGRTTGAKTWKILYQVLGQAPRTLAELPLTPELRSGPRLLSWPRSDWLAWAELKNDSSFSYSRLQLPAGKPMSWFKDSDFALDHTASPNGCVARRRERGSDEGEHNFLDLYAVSTGQVVATIPYRWADQSPANVFCSL